MNFWRYGVAFRLLQSRLRFRNTSHPNTNKDPHSEFSGVQRQTGPKPDPLCLLKDSAPRTVEGRELTNRHNHMQLANSIVLPVGSLRRRSVYIQTTGLWPAASPCSATIDSGRMLSACSRNLSSLDWDRVLRLSIKEWTRSVYKFDSLSQRVDCATSHVF